MPKDRNKKEGDFLDNLTPDKIVELAEMLTKLVVESASLIRPDSGQPVDPDIMGRTAKEVQALITEMVDAKRWMKKLDPVIHEFLTEWAVRDDLDNTPDKEKLMQSISKAFPALDPITELHALRLLIVHWITHGQFKNIKEETQIKIVSEMLQVITASLEYLSWRIRKTVPAKDAQH